MQSPAHIGFTSPASIATSPSDSLLRLPVLRRSGSPATRSGLTNGRRATGARGALVFAVATVCAGQRFAKRSRRTRMQGVQRGSFFRHLLEVPPLSVVADDTESIEDDCYDSEDEFCMVPEADSVEAKPIYIFSDCSGDEPLRLLQTHWAQFADAEEGILRSNPNLQSKADIDAAVREAYMAAHSGALVMSAMASEHMRWQLAKECGRLGLLHVDLVEPLISALSSVPVTGDGDLKTVMVVSDETGDSGCYIAKTAHQQQGDELFTDLQVCPRVRSLEAINTVVTKARETGALIAFTFASEGASRYMRKRCGQSNVRYADLSQPLFAVLEQYLSYSAFGVPTTSETELTFEQRSL